MAPKPPTRNDWNPFADIFRPFREQQQRAEPRPQRRATQERQRQRRQEPGDGRDTARPTVARAANRQPVKPGRLPARVPVPEQNPRTRQRGFDVPGVNGLFGVFRGLEVSAKARGSISSPPSRDVRLPQDDSGRTVPADFDASIRLRGRKVDADARFSRPLTYQGDESFNIPVSITGVTVRNNQPTAASYRALGLFTGTANIDPKKLPQGGPGLQARVNLTDLVGPGVQLRPADGPNAVRAKVVVDGDRMRFDITMRVRDGVIGDRRGGHLNIRNGGEVTISGIRNADGTTQVNVTQLDVRGAQITMPTARGRAPDTFEASQLRMSNPAGLTFNGTRLVSAKLEGAEVRGLRTNLTVTNPGDGRPATLVINDPSTSRDAAGFRRIDFSMTPERRDRPATGQETAANLRFSAETSTGLDVRLQADARGVPLDVRNGLVATLHNGTQLSGAGTIAWNGVLRGDSTLATSSLELHGTEPDPRRPNGRVPLMLTTRADLHGVNQVIGDRLAAANFSLGMVGQLAITDYNSARDKEAYDFSLRFRAQPTLGPEQTPASIRVTQVPRDPKADPASLASGAVDGAQLDVNLDVTRTPDQVVGDQRVEGRLRINGAITGGIATGNLHMPLSDGVLDIGISRADQAGARTAVHIPVNVDLGPNGAIRAPLPGPGFAADTWDACQRTLNSNATLLPAAVHGGHAALCAAGVNIQARHQAGDMSVLPAQPGTLAEQQEAIVRAKAAFRLDAVDDQVAANERALANRDLDAGLARVAAQHRIDLNSAPMTPNDAMRAIRLGDLVRNTQNIAFRVDVPLGAEQRTFDLTPPGASSALWDGALTIQPGTTMRVETPENDPNRISVRFVGPDGRERPISVRSNPIHHFENTTTFGGFDLVRGPNGEVQGRPFNDRAGDGHNAWDYLGEAIPKLFATPANLPADRPQGSFAATTLGNLIDTMGLQIDAESNPASTVSNALRTDEMRRFVGTALRGASITNAHIDVRENTPIVFGNNFLSLAGATRLDITKAAGDQGITVVGNDVTLGPTRVVSPGRSMELASGSARRIAIRANVSDDLTVRQDVDLDGIRADRVRMRMDEPAGQTPGTSWELGPARVAGDLRLTMEQFADRRRTESTPNVIVAGLTWGSTTREIVEPTRPTVTTFRDVALSLDGPLTARNLRIPKASEESGSATIDELNLDARNARIVVHDDQLTVTSDAGSRVRLRYGGELVAPQPVPVRVDFGRGSEAVGQLHRLSSYIGGNPDIHRIELDIADLRSQTSPTLDPTHDEQARISGSITVNGTPLAFRSDSAVLVAPRIHVRNFSDDADNNFRRINVAALSLPGTVLNGRVVTGEGDEMARANLRVDTDVMFAFSQNADGDRARNAAAGYLQLLNARILGNAGGIFQLPVTPGEVERGVRALPAILAGPQVVPPVPSPRRGPPASNQPRRKKP